MNFLYKIRFVKYIIKRSILKQLKLNCPLPASILLTNEISRDFTIFQNFNSFCKIRFVEYLIKRSILKRLKLNCQLAASILFTNEISWDFTIFQNLNLLCNHYEQTGHLFRDKQVNHRRNTFQPSFQGTVTRPGPLGNSIKRPLDLLNYFLIFQRTFFSVQFVFTLHVFCSVLVWCTLPILNWKKIFCFYCSVLSSVKLITSQFSMN